MILPECLTSLQFWTFKGNMLNENILVPVVSCTMQSSVLAAFASFCHVAFFVKAPISYPNITVYVSFKCQPNLLTFPEQHILGRKAVRLLRSLSPKLTHLNLDTPTFSSPISTDDNAAITQEAHIWTWTQCRHEHLVSCRSAKREQSVLL